MNIFSLIDRQTMYYAAAIIAAVIFSYVVFFTGDDRLAGVETQVVEKTDIALTVSETGTLSARREADLSFEVGGIISNIPVAEGQRVATGTLLASLNNTQQQAEVAVAAAQLRTAEAQLAELQSGAGSLTRSVSEASLASAQIALENAEENLTTVRKQQNQLVENARKALYSNDLQAYLAGGGSEDTDFSYEQPEITGTYTSTEKGEYRIELYPSGARSGYSFEFSGLESGRREVSTTEPQPLGTRGLYIEFPDDFARRSGLEWVVPVPNTRSSTYQTRLNEYESAIENRESAIEQAENTLRSAEGSLAEAEAQRDETVGPARTESIAAQAAVVDQREAALQAARAAFEKTRITAPFAGVVADMSLTEGEFVGAGISAISLISDNAYEITVDVPEADIAQVDLGDGARVRFDAFDEDVFAASVVSVAPSAENVDGVPVFEVTLHFSERYERLRSGLSADVDIQAASREDVIAVPARAILRQEDGTAYVRVLENGERIVRRSVETGLRGSNGAVEITQGLTAGDEVITFITQEAQARLSDQL